MPKIGEFLFGKGDKMKKISTLSPEQKQLFQMLTGSMQDQGMPEFLGQNQGYQNGLNYLQNLYSQSPDAFDHFSAPYIRQFKEEIVPGLAERFSMAGGKNSSAFNQAMGRAAEGLQTNLASQLESLKSSLLPQLLGYSQAPFDQYQGLLNNALGMRTFENVYQPGSSGLLGNALTGFAQGLGGSTNPMSMLSGMGSMLSGLSGMFGGGAKQSGGSPYGMMGNHIGAYGLPTFMGW